jgi:hypothetical protein
MFEPSLSATIILEICTDDRIFVKSANQVFLVGTLGSNITTTENNSNYPLSDKKVINKLRPYLHNFMRNFAKKNHMLGIGVTSHDHCGAAALQGLTDSAAVEKFSKNFMAKNRDYPDYLLHITEQPQPLIIKGKNLGTIEIPAGPHDARRTVWTVGGFATQPERGDKSFLLSADWFAEALRKGAKMEDLRNYVLFASALTNSIMRTNLKNEIFDAGRLGKDAAQNNQLLKNFLT